MVTLGNDIFPANFLDRKCYAEFEARMKSKVSEGVKHIQIQMTNQSQILLCLLRGARFKSSFETGAHAVLC